LAGSAPVPVVHTVELLDWATGGAMPRVLARRGVNGAPAAEPAATAPVPPRL
jgi:glycolate oxidase iron-sulfur subunit